MTDVNRSPLNDILAGFRPKNVKPQSIATAQCKWDILLFNPSQQTIPGFLVLLQNLGHGAYGEDALNFIETTF